MSWQEFDEVVERRGTNSLKFDFAVERGKPADVLPLWVADMDFRAPKPVREALHAAVEHGIFGYSEVKGAYYEALADWFGSRFGWKTQEDWLVKTPGVVYALAMAVRALTVEGDAVLLQPPVYYPFYSVIEDNGRVAAESPLRLVNGHYEIDFDDFEKTIRTKNVKLFLLCSPHNPVGRVWTEAELREIGRICKKYGVFVVADEIHCDFAFANHPHTVFLQANPDMQDQVIVCTAPSKTFNLAGLQISNIWIPGEEARRAFCREIDRSGYSQLNALGLIACEAAYRRGGNWLAECKAYLQANLGYLREFLQKNLPEIQLIEPEGMYFAWLDCRRLGMNEKELEDLVTNRAKLWLDAGRIFGKDSWGFQRMVLACPRKTLAQALTQLEEAIHSK